MWDDSTKAETLLSSALFKDEKSKKHASMRETVDEEHKLSTKRLKTAFFHASSHKVSKEVLTRHPLWGASRSMDGT